MERDLDNAIETAANHVREAEDRLVETPVDSPEIVAEARTVHHRTKDLSELAVDATSEAEEGPPHAN
jgi:hypothetical protein